MIDRGYWLEAAKTAELDLGKVTSFSESQAPYVTDAVTQEMTRRFGRGTLLKGGMRVQTTIDLELQIMAQQVVRWGHAELSSSGYYADEVALIAVEPYTHFVKAVVGGIDYERSQFNRATQAWRQHSSRLFTMPPLRRVSMIRSLLLTTIRSAIPMARQCIHRATMTALFGDRLRSRRHWFIPAIFPPSSWGMT